MATTTESSRTSFPSDTIGSLTQRSLTPLSLNVVDAKTKKATATAMPDGQSNPSQSGAAPDKPTESSSSDNSSPRHSPRQGLAHLLGSGLAEWPHSDESLTEALRLRQEQERTKQEYYRLETRKRVLDILTMAVRAGVPGSAIPSLFEGQQHQVALPVHRTAAAAAANTASSVGAKPATPQRTMSPVELVNYEDAQRSPTRFRPTHTRSSSAMPAYSAAASRPITQAYFPVRQVPPATAVGQSSPQSKLQFHHWKPNQTRERAGSNARDRDEDTNKRRSVGAVETKPEPPGSPQPTTPAGVIAAQNQRRRKLGHARHRSEVAVPTTSRGSWYRPDDGVSILASMASERSKHDVGYILAPNSPRSSHSTPQQTHPNVQSSPGHPTNRQDQPGP